MAALSRVAARFRRREVTVTPLPLLARDVELRIVDARSGVALVHADVEALSLVARYNSTAESDGWRLLVAVTSAAGDSSFRISMRDRR